MQGQEGRPSSPRHVPPDTMRVHDDWLLTPERAAVHVPTATAVVADLHLGYDRARCRNGEAVPGLGVEEVLAALRSVASRWAARRLVVAGDLLEDGRCAGAANQLLERLPETGLKLAAVVPGNHDRGLPGLEGRLPLFPEGLELGGWRVVHGDGGLPPGRVVQGHLHPCLRWAGKAAPCFLVGPDLLVLPALSPEAAGVNVLRDRRWRALRCCVPARGRVLDFGPLAGLAGKIARSP